MVKVATGQVEQCNEWNETAGFDCFIFDSFVCSKHPIRANEGLLAQRSPF